MDALAEQLIAIYLTRGGRVFIIPQYAIPAPGSNSDWACPDFVALDFDKREVVVVEVTSGTDPATIIGNARDRDARWFYPLRAKMTAEKVIDDSWDMRFLGFVRKQNLARARKALAGHEKVAFTAIEDATFAWDYWEDRKEGLPR
jgi:hypothetical protein